MEVSRQDSYCWIIRRCILLKPPLAVPFALALNIIIWVGCSYDSTPPPNIDATVAARVQATLQMMPTPTQGPVLTSAEAIAIVQGYLESKTYVTYSRNADEKPWLRRGL